MVVVCNRPSLIRTLRTTGFDRIVDHDRDRRRGQTGVREAAGAADPPGSP